MAGNGTREFTTEGILAGLRRAGMRVTASRRKILDALFASNRPMTLEEIRAAASRGGRAPDYATVFRMVALLERRGILRKVNLNRACSYFELQDPSRHYDHLVCTSCGRVEAITEPCPLGPFERSLARRHGFRDIHHSLEFFGRCPKC